ncbi:MAG TPA: ABC transporter ATP-binding protein [Trueperaceae bacterium]|nr:ABC transporter ATP-binding protein [Trueperaceae bacterium]
MATLQTRGLKRHYGKILAVDGIDLATAEGELLAVLGPSGSGKSTLMRMVAGLEQPSGGDILLDGRSVVGIPARKRNVAMVFQSYALYPHMSVFENIVFPLRSYRVPKETWKGKVDWAAGVLGIEHLLQRRPGRLSGGESQRVALARALVRDPEMFIFDEPLSALDAQVRHTARAELRDLQKRTQVTCLYVTHDQVEAMGLGDRVAVMKDGQLRQLGAPRELYFEPEDDFVASFIGNPPMNLLARGDALIGIRAEHFRLLQDGDEPDVGEHRFRVRLDQLEFLGSEWLGYGRVADAGGEEEAGGEEDAGRKRARGDGHVVVRFGQDRGSEVAPGQAYDFAVPGRHIKTFDRSTGRRRHAGTR